MIQFFCEKSWFGYCAILLGIVFVYSESIFSMEIERKKFFKDVPSLKEIALKCVADNIKHMSKAGLNTLAHGISDYNALPSDLVQPLMKKLPSFCCFLYDLDGLKHVVNWGLFNPRYRECILWRNGAAVPSRGITICDLDSGSVMYNDQNLEHCRLSYSALGQKLLVLNKPTHIDVFTKELSHCKTISFSDMRIMQANFSLWDKIVHMNCLKKSKNTGAQYSIQQLYDIDVDAFVVDQASVMLFSADGGVMVAAQQQDSEDVFDVSLRYTADGSTIAIVEDVIEIDLSANREWFFLQNTDLNCCMFNLKTREIKQIKYVSQCVESVKFSCNGEYLAINDGITQILLHTSTDSYLCGDAHSTMKFVMDEKYLLVEDGHEDGAYLVRLGDIWGVHGEAKLLISLLLSAKVHMIANQLQFFPNPHGCQVIMFDPESNTMVLKESIESKGSIRQFSNVIDVLWNPQGDMALVFTRQGVEVVYFCHTLSLQEYALKRLIELRAVSAESIQEDGEFHSLFDAFTGGQKKYLSQFL